MPYIGLTPRDIAHLSWAVSLSAGPEETLQLCSFFTRRSILGTFCVSPTYDQHTRMTLQKEERIAQPAYVSQSFIY